MVRWFVTGIALSAVFGNMADAALVQDTLYINRGTFTTVSGTTFPWLAFNANATFDPLNKVVMVVPGDILELTVVNNDTAVHGIAIQDMFSQPGVLAPGSMTTVQLNTTTERTYIYSDPTDLPKYTYLGLAGMICVTGTSSQRYFWNIKEHLTGFNQVLAAGGAVDWSAYEPDYFTINGKSFPDLQNDLSAKINCAVGDTVRICVVNTGHSAHSIHFHGFHCTALFDSDELRTNWSKDTWPMKPMSAAILWFVADKPGQYSIHDHNLVAVSGGGTHPNGMFLITDVAP